MVDKATYTAWEAAVVKKFYTTERSQTPLIPTKGKPSVLSKEKFILVADACAALSAAGLRPVPHARTGVLGEIAAPRRAPRRAASARAEEDRLDARRGETRRRGDARSPRRASRATPTTT